MSVLLEVKQVTKIYSDESVATAALQGVNFRVEEGEFVSIMGPSGSGKSTLLHILGLLDRPTEGKYFITGQDTTDLDDQERARIRNQEIGFIFQAFHLLARASVLDNVMLPLLYSSIPPSQHKKRALETLEQVKLTHRLNHQPSQLSGGEKQRVAIARSLVNKPKIILADEPTGNLDSKTGAGVLDIIDNLHKHGQTVLMITHETPTAEYAQRIINVKDGLITTDNQIKKKRHHYYK